MPLSEHSTLSRRLAVLATLVAPLGAEALADDGADYEPDTPVRLIQRARAANDAFVRGDMTTWLDLAGPIPDDFTLMQPFGGPASHGFNASPARLAEMARTFRNGEATFELLQSYASDDMIALVFIERQTCEVGGLPKQDWSLRVTQIYQRRGEQWLLVHRHADPLTHNRDLARTAAIARGD